MAVTGGLCHSSISRLKDTSNLLPPDITKVFQILNTGVRLPHHKAITIQLFSLESFTFMDIFGLNAFMCDFVIHNCMLLLPT